MALETFEIISSPPIFKLQGSQKKKRKTKGGGHEKIFEEIVVESFPNMEKEIANQVQEAQKFPYWINPRRKTPRHILIQLTKTNTNKQNTNKD